MGSRAVKGRALEDRHIFEALVRGLENAQTGKAKVAEWSRRLQRPKVEISGVVNHLLRHAVLDNVDPDRRRVNKATMQRLEGKAKLLIAPERGPRNASDRSVLLEGEAGKDGWPRGRLGRLERLRSQFRRHSQHRVASEGNWLAPRLRGRR